MTISLAHLSLDEIEEQAKRLLVLVPPKTRISRAKLVWQVAYGLLLVGGVTKVDAVIESTRDNADDAIRYMSGAVRQTFADVRRNWVDSLSTFPEPPATWPPAIEATKKILPLDRERIRNRIFLSDKARWFKATNSQIDAEIDRQVAEVSS